MQCVAVRPFSLPLKRARVSLPSPNGSVDQRKSPSSHARIGSLVPASASEQSHQNDGTARLCGPPSLGYGSFQTSDRRQQALGVNQENQTRLREETEMAITRRRALASAAAAALASGLAKPAIAAKEPILIGYLPALTGPSSSTGVGINRGIQLAVEEINKAGGIDGRQLELITRDTQSDPTKAVNGAAELTRGAKVTVVFGPVNSGESLAVTPLLARTNTPQVHPCWVDSLTDPKKYPMCFRNAPTNQQIGGAANC